MNENLQNPPVPIYSYRLLADHKPVMLTSVVVWLSDKTGRDQIVYHNSKMIILYVKKDHCDGICGRGVGKGGGGVGGSGMVGRPPFF